MDQVAPQNLSNSPTTICKKSEPNIMIQNPDKFSVTGIGLQRINGNSLIEFSSNSRTKEMIRFVTKAREINCEKEYNLNKLSQILSYEDLTIKVIIEQLKNKTNYDEKLIILIYNELYPNKTKKQIIDELEPYIEKDKMTKKEKTANLKKLETIKRKIYLKLLKPLQNSLLKEKRMVIVLDNYSVHHAVLFKKACGYLNIT
jgi:hypothetical protein